ncbi:hypothetical protein MMC18_007888 [Xylographa bjoerkii]|nr:hypothetical protein [Xylographa bjoerkii]
MNAACLAALPPLAPSAYQLQGTYDDIAGLRTYITNAAPPLSIPARGLILVYDIFGLLAPTLHGADRLARALHAVVLVPDFFAGEPLPLGLLPADTAAKKARAQAFLAGTADVGANGERLGRVRREAGERWNGVQGWGLAALASGDGTAFKASGTAHPGRLALADAAHMTIPHICLFSPEDGTAEARAAYAAALRLNPRNEVEEYADMFHGWMGGRARLEEEANAREFARGARIAFDGLHDLHAYAVDAVCFPAILSLAIAFRPPTAIEPADRGLALSRRACTFRQPSLLEFGMWVVQFEGALRG